MTEWNIEDIICDSTAPEASACVTAPYDHLSQLPGANRNVRYRFLVGLNESFLHIPNEDILAEVGEIINILHCASLLVDDIEDSSTFRRGKPCAHIEYGIPRTLNSANYMYFVAMQRAATSLPRLWASSRHTPDYRIGQPQTKAVRDHIVGSLTEEMLNLHHGQGLDIYWRDNLAELLRTGLPSVGDYLQMVKHKTAGLFRIALRLFGVFSEQDPDALAPLVNLLGIIYQIRDDYLSLLDERHLALKGTVGEDLVEGKLSLPILYTLTTFPGESPLQRLLVGMTTPRQRRQNINKVVEAIVYMKACGAFQFTHRVLREYVEKATQMILRLNPDKDQVLLKIVAGFADVAACDS